MALEFLEQVLVQLQNPAIMALLLSIIWNIGGYIKNAFKLGEIPSYEWKRLAETITIFETVGVAFVALIAVYPAIPVWIAPLIEIIVVLAYGIVGKATPAVPT